MVIKVNPVPQTYACLCSGIQVRGFGARPFGEAQNIPSRTHVRGVLWSGVNPGSYLFAAAHLIYHSPLAVKFCRERLFWSVAFVLIKIPENSATWV